jgi:hypothetical protein
MLYGLPNGWFYANVDTSDILDKGLKNKREEQLIEEQIAAQILQARQAKIEIPAEVDPVKLINVLKAKIADEPLNGEVSGAERQKRLHIMMLLMMDD